MTKLDELLRELRSPDVRRLAWTIGSASLFAPEHPAWDGLLRDDVWAQDELERRAEALLALDRAPQRLQEALGDPMADGPLGHTFEKLVLFWQLMRPEVRAATRGLTVRSGGRTLGEFDIVVLRHDGVVETLEVTVKFYLYLNPQLGIEGIIGPRAFDRMAEKWRKMTERQIRLGDTEEGRLALCDWLRRACGLDGSPEQLRVENAALSRGYLFHAAEGQEQVPPEIARQHGRGFWCRDEDSLLVGHWRRLTGREWLGPYQGSMLEQSWPVDPRMPELLALLDDSTGADGRELLRGFRLRPDSGLLRAAGLAPANELGPERSEIVD